MIAALLVSTIAALQIVAVPPQSLADDLQTFEAGLRTCGVSGRPEFTEDSPATREYWLTVSGPEATPASARCLAADPSLDSLMIYFTDPALADAFDETRAARPDVRAVAERSLQDQREWLDEKGWLADRPRLVPGTPVTVFAAATERHCGVTPGSLLQADAGTGAITFVGGDGADGLDRFMCVFGVISVAMAEDAPDLSLRMMGEDAAE
ncbi:hypothetical protein [Brevundimonas sp. FT23042]|uniref:hypothetical protein n=1 Tax=Brevundimonas sp. FT23042 TaxID=3393749 RepID=UPI003B58A9AA